MTGWTIRSPAVGMSRIRVLLILALGAVFASVALLLLSNSVRVGFLFEFTGWDIEFSVIPYTTRAPYWWAFLVGLGNTVFAGILCIFLATLLGFLLGLVRVSTNKLLADLAKVYVDVIRNIPLILQAMFWYTVILNLPPVRSAANFFDAVFLSNRGLVIPKFSDGLIVFAAFAAALVLLILGHSLSERLSGRSAGSRPWGRAILAIAALSALIALIPALPAAAVIEWPQLAGLNFRGGWRIPPEFAALIAAITIYRSAFMSEVFRGGFTSISPGQIDAAKSLGLSPLATLVKIRIPLALISILPPLSSEYIIIMKVTSIGILIGFMDLFAVSSMSSMLTGRVIEVLVTMTLLYIALNYFIASIMNAVNRRMQLRGFSDNA